MRTLGDLGFLGQLTVDEADLGAKVEGHCETVEARTEIGRRSRNRNSQLQWLSAVRHCDETVENLGRGSTVDRFTCGIDTGRHVGGDSGDDQCRTGVEEDDVAMCSMISGQHATNGVGVHVGCATHELFIDRRSQAERHRIDGERAHLKIGRAHV